MPYIEKNLYEKAHSTYCVECQLIQWEIVEKIWKQNLIKLKYICNFNTVLTLNVLAAYILPRGRQGSVDLIDELVQ